MKTEEETKKTCYNCAYRGTLSGSAHSKCNFDWQKSNLNPPKANAHGIKNGWYRFPLNYDPVWQEEQCKAHAKKVDKEMVAKHNPFLNLLSMLK